MCLEEDESPKHLFLQCKFAGRLWAAILRRFGMSWVMPCYTSKLFQHWQICTSMSRYKVPWNLSLFAGCCKIWIERNIRVFNGKSKNVSDVVDVIVWSVSNWVSRDKVFKDVSLHDLHISWEVYFCGG